jgi:hypothetical protein
VDDVQSLTFANGANSITIGALADTTGIATVYGGTGDDSFNASGMTHAVTLYGGNGDAQSGADTLIGGSGGDWLQAWTNASPALNSSNDTLTGGAGADRFVLGDAIGNAYGQFNAADPDNKRARILDFAVDNTAGDDIFRVFANDVDVASFANVGGVVTFGKNAGGNAYTLTFADNGGGGGTASLYVNGATNLMASLTYTGNGADFAASNFQFV